jgi:ABC-type enterochelin transport system permease subunit
MVLVRILMSKSGYDIHHHKSINLSLVILVGLSFGTSFSNISAILE